MYIYICYYLYFTVTVDARVQLSVINAKSSKKTRRLPSPIVPGMSSKKPPHKDDKDEDVVSSGSDTESESEEDEDTVSIT